MKPFLRYVFLTLLAIATVPQVFAQDASLQQAIKHHLSRKGPADGADKPIMDDLDGDGSPEAVVRYCIDENRPGGKNAGALNPANVHCELAVFKRNHAQWSVVGQVKLGQGIIREVTRGVVHIELTSFGPKDPLCCPSQKRLIRLVLRKGKLAYLR